MSLIVVDGYNVIGTMHADPDAERRRLVEELAAYSRRSGNEVTVVFDGWKDGRGTESREVVAGVTVVFSALGEKADSVVRRIVRDSPGHWIVVSSDREVQRGAWSSGSTPVGSEEFIRAIGAGGDGFEEGDLGYSPPKGKGNPRRPSRKKRALDRALRKL